MSNKHAVEKMSSFVFQSYLIYLTIENEITIEENTDVRKCKKMFMRNGQYLNARIITFNEFVSLKQFLELNDGFIH